MPTDHLFAALGRTPPAPLAPTPRAARRSRPVPRRVTTALLLVLAVTVTVLGATSGVGHADSRPLRGVRTVATGTFHSCAVIANQRAACWGDNTVGQVGIGITSTNTGTVVVRNRAGTGPLRGVVAVTTGHQHSCALLENHQVRCWGSGTSGELGDTQGRDAYLPVVVRDPSGVGPLRDVVEISASFRTTCARLASRELRCWGDNQAGQLGDGAAGGYVATPQTVLAVSGAGALRGVTQVDVGETHVCARLANGQARCWGGNVYSQLGDGTDDYRYRPVVVRNGAGTGPLTGVRRIAAGVGHTCATKTDGTARCWGANGDGQLGTGTTDPHPLPATVVADISRRTPLRGIAAVDTGAGHSCARLTNGQARCWGHNEQDELGDGVHIGMSITVPVAVRNPSGTANLGRITQLRTTAQHTCVRLTTGQARCWGYGETGALGDGGSRNRPVARTVLAVSPD